MIKMNISLTGIKEFEESLNRMSTVTRDFTPELRDIGEWYIDFVTNDVFETDGQVIGEKWPELSDAYKRRKAGVYKDKARAGFKGKVYAGRGILEASGFMRTHWKLFTASQYALITNQADYAIYHQNGTSKMPQRMFVKFDREREEHITKMFSDGILKRIIEAVR